LNAHAVISFLSGLNVWGGGGDIEKDAALLKGPTFLPDRILALDNPVYQRIALIFCSVLT